MKNFIYRSIAILAVVLLLSSFKSQEYDIQNFYNGLEPSSGTKAICDDEVKEMKMILVPLKLKEGKFVVNITRIAKDLYKVDGKNIYIETRYCYEYSSGQEVVLNVENEYGYTKGKLIF